MGEGREQNRHAFPTAEGVKRHLALERIKFVTHLCVRIDGLRDLETNTSRAGEEQSGIPGTTGKSTGEQRLELAGRKVCGHLGGSSAEGGTRPGCANVGEAHTEPTCLERMSQWEAARQEAKVARRAQSLPLGKG